MLVSASATFGLAYKTQKGSNANSIITSQEALKMYFEEITGHKLGDDFSPAPLIKVNSHMLDFNFVGRASIQYNSGHFFAGTRFVYNYYNYHQGDRTLRTDNGFWNWRLFAGYRFGKKHVKDYLKK